MTDYRDPDDERVHDLLHDAVRDIDPPDRLDSIRARTRVRSIRRRRTWFLGAGAAVIATAATVATVAVVGGLPGTEQASGPGFAGGTPGGAASSTVTTPPAPSTASGSPTEQAATDDPSSDVASSDPTATAGAESGTQALPVYYAGETSYGLRLFREFHRTQLDGQDPISAALTQAVSTKPDDGDYRTDWPAGTRVEEVNLDDSGSHTVVTVHLANDATDLRQRPEQMSREQARLALQQLVYTAEAAAQSQLRMSFVVEGEPADTVLGVDTAQPVTEADQVEVVALVWIIDPPEGAKLTTPFTVSGLANAFEATVHWELSQDGTVVKHGTTTAKQAFVMAPYEFTVKSVPPGDYTLTVTDDDPTGGTEGPGVSVDTKSITVLP
jgi:hypothetical protein